MYKDNPAQDQVIGLDSAVDFQIINKLLDNNMKVLGRSTNEFAQ